MTDAVTFTIPIPDRRLGQNGDRVHWATRKRIKDDFQESVIVAFMEEDGKHKHGMVRLDEKPWASAEVFYNWFSCQQPDADNAFHRLKSALDCLTAKGTRGVDLLEDDKDVVVSFAWHKAAHRPEERVEVTVTKRDV